MQNTNILILSSGTRNKIIQYFKRELSGIGQVFATDCSNLAPALYEADEYFIVPRIDDPGYLDIILDLCKKHDIKCVLTLIDPEISLLAQHADRFNAIGVVPMVSSFEVVERSFDKYDFYSWLREHNYRSALTYEDKELFYQDVEKGLLGYPVFMKPRRGSASLNISKAYDKDDVEFLLKRHPDLLIQEYMDGTEIGVDVYVDLITKKVVSIFTKEKILMRAGETDKSVSFKDPKLFELITRFVEESGYVGAIDIDIFRVENEYYISEVNPRFGGGYLHAHECGVSFPRLLVNNLQGMENQASIGDYPAGTVMMKYNEVIVSQM